MKITYLIGALVASLAAQPASAALFVTGDSNILGASSVHINTLPANQRFILNIAGNNVLIQRSSAFYTDNTTEALNLSSFLQTQSINSTITDSSLELDAADFVGRTLFIGYGSEDAYTTNEVALMGSFLNAGGSILFAGENSIFSESNGFINSALTGLGSSMRIVDDAIDNVDYTTANVLTSNPFTTGTTGLQFVSASYLTGGNGLYGTATGNKTFVAFDRSIRSAVPEPATWAMMFAGFGIVGSTLRRRSRANSVRAIAG